MIGKRHENKEKVGKNSIEKIRKHRKNELKIFWGEKLQRKTIKKKPRNNSGKNPKKIHDLYIYIYIESLSMVNNTKLNKNAKKKLIKRKE